MFYLLGLLVAVASLVAAAVHLHQAANHFWDFVAFACVTGGTLAVALMTFPWQYRRIIARSIVLLFTPNGRSEGEVVAEAIEFIRKMQSGARIYECDANSLAREIFRDGAELLNLGFSKEKVHFILEERIHQSFERSQKISNAFRSLAKYPPAFGLAGTVLGLVTLMRKVSDGADAKQTGLLMAIALMATFYGLLTSNLLINPAGENLMKSFLDERKKSEIALHAVLLYAEGAGLLEAQEVLNSYVTQDQRVNVVDGAAAGAA